MTHEKTNLKRVMIVGGHGKVALLAAPQLIAQGFEVTSAFRNPAHALEVEATGARAVVADIEKLSLAEFSELLTGQDALVWSAGAGGGNPERTYAVDRDAAIRSVDTARAAQVARFVMVSYYGAGSRHGIAEDDSFFPYADAKSAADNYLRGSDLEWTILRPSRLTLEPASGRIELNTEVDAPPSSARQVSRANVAAVIAAVLETPATRGLVLNVNDGDEPIREALARLTS